MSLSRFMSCLHSAHENDVRSLISHRPNDFVAERTGGESAEEIAVAAIEHFCIDDGSFNNNQLALGAILRYLGRETETRITSKIVENLLAILNTGSGIANLTEWATSSFGPT